MVRIGTSRMPPPRPRMAPTTPAPSDVKSTATEKTVRVTSGRGLACTPEEDRSARGKARAPRPGGHGHAHHREEDVEPRRHDHLRAHGEEIGHGSLAMVA